MTRPDHSPSTPPAISIVRASRLESAALSSPSSWRVKLVPNRPLRRSCYQTASPPRLSVPAPSRTCCTAPPQPCRPTRGQVVDVPAAHRPSRIRHRPSPRPRPRPSRVRTVVEDPVEGARPPQTALLTVWWPLRPQTVPVGHPASAGDSRTTCVSRTIRPQHPRPPHDPSPIAHPSRPCTRPPWASPATASRGRRRPPMAPPTSTRMARPAPPRKPCRRTTLATTGKR